MSLFDETRPLKIIYEIGGERVLAALFPLPEDKGLCFFDVGHYPDPSFNAKHFIEGFVRGEGPWYIQQRECSIARIEVIGKDDPFMRVWESWQSFRTENIPDPDRLEREIFTERLEEQG
jgi:hypothetical protein